LIEDRSRGKCSVCHRKEWHSLCIGEVEGANSIEESTFPHVWFVSGASTRLGHLLAEEVLKPESERLPQPAMSRSCRVSWNNI